MATDAKGAKMPFRTDDDVRAYVRKRKRSNKNCSVSHLRRALNIGYKKAKRIHDEVEEELRSGKLVLDNEDYDQDSPDEEEVAPRPTRAARRRTATAAAAAAAAEADAEEEDSSGISDDLIREHIRKKLAKGEIIYVNKMRALGITYRRARRIIQEFVDQGKIQKLPKNYTINGSGGGAATPGTPRTRRAVAEARARQEAGGRAASPTSSPSITGSPREDGEGKRVPPKQKAKEENKKAVENSRSPSGDEEGGEGEGERMVVGSGAGHLNGQGQGDARRNLAGAVGMELSSAIGMQFGAGSLLPADVGSIPATLTIANLPLADVPDMLVAKSEPPGAPDLSLIPDDIPATLDLVPERPAEQAAGAAGEAVQHATEEVVSGGEEQHMLHIQQQEDPAEILAALLPEGSVDAVAISEDTAGTDETAAQEAEVMMEESYGGEQTEAAPVEHQTAESVSQDAGDSSTGQPVATQEDVASAMQGDEAAAKTS